MKKTMLVSSVFLILCAGCSQSNSNSNESVKTPESTSDPIIYQTKETEKEVKVVKKVIPEPYSLALTKIKVGDFDTALKYLDLTINDFKDSPYVYNAQLLKSILYRGKAQAILELSLIIAKSPQKGIELYSKAELSNLKEKLNKINKDIKDNTNLLVSSAKFTYDHFSEIKDSIEITNINVNSIPSDGDLSFFEKVGYPFPTDDELKSYFNRNYAKYVSTILEITIKDNKVMFPEYFFYMGNGIGKDDKVLTKLLLEKTIELTESDKYNEIRIKAQDTLKSIQ
ncbi:hypothetical protein [Paenibacillus sp. KN14-4R]|uniref:hypothetical protein n=1 Tax=Paenibacillus sp. KN14-4R TaxID=3445773 RepID=UPI003FA19102